MKPLILTLSLILVGLAGKAQSKQKIDSCKLADIYFNAYMSCKDESKRDSLYSNAMEYNFACQRYLIAGSKRSIKKLSKLINHK